MLIGRRVAVPRISFSRRGLQELQWHRGLSVIEEFHQSVDFSLLCVQLQSMTMGKNMINLVSKSREALVECASGLPVPVESHENFNANLRK